MIRKHLVLMAIGCLLPLAVLAAIFIFQVQIHTALLLGLVVLCPVVHLHMMRDHMGHGAHQALHHGQEMVL